MRIIAVFLLSLAVSCCGRSKEYNLFGSTRHFITGVYSYTEHTRFYAVWDTIIISRKKTAGTSVYLVVRSAEIQCNLDDAYASAEQSKKHWTAVYDEESRTLTSTGKELEITFPSVQDNLVLNGISYSRVE